MPKIVAVSAAKAKAESSLPAPTIVFEVFNETVNGEEVGVIRATCEFRGVDPDLYTDQRKQTLFLAEALRQPIKFGEGEETQVLGLDSEGRQPLQFSCSISAPALKDEQKAPANGASSETPAAEETEAVTSNDDVTDNVAV